MAHPSEVVTRPALNPPTIILRRRAIEPRADPGQRIDRAVAGAVRMIAAGDIDPAKGGAPLAHGLGEFQRHHRRDKRSEEQTYELQSLMRISYAVFCLTK